MATISGTSAIKNNSQLTCTYSLTVTAGTQSVSGNYTPINYSYYVLYDTASVQFTGTTRPNAGNVNVVINGTTVASKVVPLTNGIKDGTYIIATTSGTVNVPHNSDGTKTLSYSISITSGTDQNNYNYVWNASSKSGSMTLTTIPRTSSISLSGHDYLGNAVGVTITRNSTSFTHTVEYSFGSSGWKTAATGVATYHEFTAATTLGWASYIPSSSSGVLTVKVTTYSGSTAIGSATATKTLNISSQQSAHQPTFGTITAEPVSDTVPSSWGLYVSGHSKVKVTISGCAGVYGSTIKSYSIYGSGLNVSASSGTSSILTTNKSAGSDLSYVGTVIDSRNQQSSKSTTIHVVPYTPPSVSVTAVRCESDGTESANGTSLKVTATFSYASVSGKNSITSKSISCNGISITNFESGVAKILAANCSIGSTYELTATVTDALGKPATVTITIPTATRAVNVKANKKSVAIGKFAQTDDTFEVGWKTDIQNDLNVTGNITVDGSITTSSDLTSRILYLPNADSSITPTYPYTGIYQWGNNLQITARNSSKGYVKDFLNIDMTNGDVYIGVNTGSHTKIDAIGDVVSNASTTGGWARGYIFKGNGTTVAEIGTYGNGSALKYVYIGTAYNSTWVRVDSGGLSVYGGAYVTGNATVDGTISCNTLNSPTISSSAITTTNTYNTGWAFLGSFGFISDTTRAWIGFYSSHANAKNAGATGRKGWCGFDTNSTNFYFYNAQGGYIGGNKAWTNASDRRLKTDIADLPDVYIDIWQELQPKMFKWNELNSPDSKYHFGLIAQDVMEVFEKHGLNYKDYGIIGDFKIEGDNETEYYAITYEYYNMMTAAVVKKQQSEIDTLKSELSELKTLVNQLLGKENQKWLKHMKLI